MEIVGINFLCKDSAIHAATSFSFRTANLPTDNKMDAIHHALASIEEKMLEVLWFSQGEIRQISPIPPLTVKLKKKKVEKEGKKELILKVLNEDSSAWCHLMDHDRERISQAIAKICEPTEEVDKI